jgi:hypothetical protein
MDEIDNYDFSNVANEVDNYDFSNVANEVDNYDFSNVVTEVDDYDFSTGGNQSNPDPYEDIAKDYVYRATPDTGIASALLSTLKNAFKKTDGSTDWRKIATAAGGLLGATGLGGLTKAQDTGPKGYQGGIPSYSLIRERVQDTYDPNRRPGSGGRRYFSDTIYSPAAGVEAARTTAQEQAAGLAALNASNPANQYITQPPAQTPPSAETQPAAARAASDVIKDLPVPTYNQGGLTALKEGKYLRGATDGMSDELRTTIDGKQPAALSHGEFVIPADVVSHLGNGNSDAGAKKLYEMMDRIRKARTGTTKQGREINPNKFLPKAR